MSRMSARIPPVPQQKANEYRKNARTREGWRDGEVACVRQAIESLPMILIKEIHACGLLVSEMGLVRKQKMDWKIKTPAKAGVCILAETEGFEPSIQV